MSQEAAKIWLSSHNRNLPSLDLHHRRALDILNNPIKPASDLADVIMLDPGMSMALFRRVNIQLNKIGKQGVATVRGALSLLSDQAVSEFVRGQKKLTDTHPDTEIQQSYHQLIAREYHLVAQLDELINLQGIRSVNDTRCAARLHHIGELFACLFDHDSYRKYQQQFVSEETDGAAESSIFGFSFNVLGRLLAKQSCLPELVDESLSISSKIGLKSCLIQLAAGIADQAEKGWYHPAMKARQKQCAEFLKQNSDGFEKHLQAVAIDAARQCPLDNIIHAATRIIMLPTAKNREVEESIVASVVADSSSTGDTISPSTIPRDKPNFESRVKSLLRVTDSTQSQLLTLLLDYLHEDLGLSRVGLILLSRDKSQLSLRASKGMDDMSAPGKLELQTEKAGLLKTLLAKPQGLWLEPASYLKYEKIIPARFKTSMQSESFYLMSLFISAKPVGLLYGDRKSMPSALDKKSYDAFKSAILLTSKALVFQHKRKRQKAA